MSTNPSAWAWRPAASKVLLILACVAFALALFRVPVGTVDETVLGLLLFAGAFALA